MDFYTFHIFEDITGDTVKDFAVFCKSLPDKANVNLDVCSYGGDVFSGIAILQMIQVLQKTNDVHFTARVWGLAASSAADIVLACNRVEMAKTAAIMIHSAWTLDGENDEGIRIANEAQMAVIHTRLPDYTEKDLKRDKWFRAEDAMIIGLIDAVFEDSQSENAKIAAKCLINSLIGGFVMKKTIQAKAEEEIREDSLKVEEEKAEEMEVVDEEKEEVKEEAPSMADALERIAERLETIEERLLKLEGGEVEAECGDPREKENARMRAVYDRISAICKPAVSKDSVTKIVKQEDPKEELERYKAKYGNMNFSAYIDKE